MTTLTVRRLLLPRVRSYSRPTVAAALVALALSVVLLAASLTYRHGSPVLGVAAAVALVGGVWLVTTTIVPLALAVLMVYLGALDGFLRLKTGVSALPLVRDFILSAVVAGVLIRSAVAPRRMEVPPLSGWVLLFVAV